MMTGRSKDLHIDGNGFFMVMPPQGAGRVQRPVPDLGYMNGTRHMTIEMSLKTGCLIIDGSTRQAGKAVTCLTWQLRWVGRRLCAGISDGVILPATRLTLRIPSQ